MTTNTSYKDGCLTMTRHYSAPREKVFEAWIETAKVQQWWGCSDTTHVASTVEPCVGGQYRHEMTIKGIHEHVIEGRFVSFEPPCLLAYEFPGEPGAPLQMVRVEFSEEGTGTLVTLKHDNIPDPFGSIILGGWTAATDKLEALLQRELDAA